MGQRLSLDQQLCFSLYASSMAVTRVYKPVLDRLGITFPQLLVLQALHETDDGMTIGAIAKRLSLDSSTVTPLAKRLESGGMVTRTRDPGDERQIIVRLTERGQVRWEETECLAEMVEDRTAMTTDRLQEINEEVKAFHDALISAEGSKGAEEGAG